MENNKQRMFNYSSLEDKHYFAGFLNLAWDNIEITFKVFFDRFGITPVKPIAAIDICFNEKVPISDYQDRIDFLKQYFPVIHYLSIKDTHKTLENLERDKRENKRREYFRSNFQILITAIRDLRDFYTHHFHEPVHLSDKFFELLDKIFLAVVKDVKQHKLKGDNTRHLLKKDLREELDKLIQSKKDYLRKQKQGGRRVNLDPLSIENAVLNDAFSHLVYKKHVDKKYQSNALSENCTDFSLNISESGLLFLLSMFLHRRENEQLRSGIKGYKAKIIVDSAKPIDRKNNSLKYMATHWVFNYLSVKPIKERLNTAFHKETLLLQIADELSKVPDELYQTFTEDQRKEFLEDINEYFKDNDETEPFERNRVIHPVIRKRYEDKFNYFALRFLDEFVDFPTLRFQVHLGNYIHDKREKWINGTGLQTQRTIKEKINVFGRLSEVSKKKSDFFFKKIDTKWEMFPEPSYNIIGNNIPIYIQLSRSKVEGAKELNSALVQLAIQESKVNRIESKSSKKEIVKEISDEFYLGSPTALFSLNELPSLLYQVLINKKTGQELEDILVETLVERYKIINEYTPNINVPTSLITKKLRRSSGEFNYDFEKLLRAVNREIQITQDKLKWLKELNDNPNKRKYVFTTKELGQEATWLAYDIKRFMPKSVRKNWKGYQHKHLQTLLAFYDTMSDELSSFLRDSWNLEDRNYFFNEWLVKSLYKNRFFQFYESYLSRRMVYFANLHQQINEFINNKKILNKCLAQQCVWSVFQKRLYTIQPTEIQKKELLLKPLVFWRGLFDEKPTYIQGKNPKNEPELFADWYRYILSETHSLQKFYTWKRDYKELFDKYKNIAEFVQNKHNLTEEQQFELFKRKWDKKIRDSIGQDIFSNLMVRRMINEMYGQKKDEQVVELTLSNYYLTQRERLEKERAAQQQSIKEKGDRSQNITKDSFVWTMNFPYKRDYIYEDAVKLKDFGKFVRFLQDEKVKRIFSYDPSKRDWTKLGLEKELEKYEKHRREDIFKLFQDIERKILEESKFDGKNHPKDFENKGNPSFKKYIIYGLLKKDTTLNEEDINWVDNMHEKTYENEETVKVLQQKDKKIQDTFLLIYLRNKFAHNQLPIKSYYDIICSRSGKKEYVTETLMAYIQQTAHTFMLK